MWRCAFVYDYSKRKFGPAIKMDKETVKSTFFVYFYHAGFFPSLFLFTAENCVGFGLKMAENNCNECREFRLFDPTLLWFGGASSEEKNS